MTTALQWSLLSMAANRQSVRLFAAGVSRFAALCTIPMQTARVGDRIRNDHDSRVRTMCTNSHSHNTGMCY